MCSIDVFSSNSLDPPLRNKHCVTISLDVQLVVLPKRGEEKGKEMSVAQAHSSPRWFRGKSSAEAPIFCHNCSIPPLCLLPASVNKTSSEMWTATKLSSFVCVHIKCLCVCVCGWVSSSPVANKTPDFFTIGPCWFLGGEILCHFP